MYIGNECGKQKVFSAFVFLLRALKAQKIWFDKRKSTASLTVNKSQIYPSGQKENDVLNCMR